MVDLTQQLIIAVIILVVVIALLPLIVRLVAREWYRVGRENITKILKMEINNDERTSVEKRSTEGSEKRGSRDTV